MVRPLDLLLHQSLQIRVRSFLVLCLDRLLFPALYRRFRFQGSLFPIAQYRVLLNLGFRCLVLMFQVGIRLESLR